MYQWQKDIWTASVKLWGKLDFVYWSDIWEWKLFSCLLSLAALRKFSTSYIEMWFFLGIIAFLDFKLSPCVECHIVFSGYSPGVWAFSADISELTSHSVFVGVVLYAYEDGTASKFQNVGTKSSDAGRLPKKTQYGKKIQVLLHDNAWPQTSLSTREAVATEGWTVPPHSLYTPI